MWTSPPTHPLPSPNHQSPSSLFLQPPKSIIRSQLSTHLPPYAFLSESLLDTPLFTLLPSDPRSPLTTAFHWTRASRLTEQDGGGRQRDRRVKSSHYRPVFSFRVSLSSPGPLHSLLLSFSLTQATVAAHTSTYEGPKGRTEPGKMNDGMKMSERS